MKLYFIYNISDIPLMFSSFNNLENMRSFTNIYSKMDCHFF